MSGPWLKRGLVVTPRPELEWSRSFCIAPTPELREDGSIRVYYGTTDASDVGRISYVDLDSREPTRVVGRAKVPLLEPGDPGAFDECGANPTSVLDWRGDKHLFYAGYQRCERTPYLIFAGLATSRDGGATFERRRLVPILERTEDELTIRSAPCVLVDGDTLRMWYVSGRGWRRTTSGKLIPEYGLRAATSRDGVTWERSAARCLEPRWSDGETGLGRPWVLRENGGFRLWYSIRREVEGSLAYTALGTAFSTDGEKWERQDESVGIARSSEGWDSEMICYAAVLELHGRALMFYNGNRNGRGGFGVAERVLG